MVSRGVTMLVARRGTANLTTEESSSARSRVTPSESSVESPSAARRMDVARGIDRARWSAPGTTGTSRASSRRCAGRRTGPEATTTVARLRARAGDRGDRSDARARRDARAQREGSRRARGETRRGSTSSSRWVVRGPGGGLKPPAAVARADALISEVHYCMGGERACDRLFSSRSSRRVPKNFQIMTTRGVGFDVTENAMRRRDAPPAVVAAPAGAQEASVRISAPGARRCLTRRCRGASGRWAWRSATCSARSPDRCVRRSSGARDPGEDASAGGKTAVRARARWSIPSTRSRASCRTAQAPRALADVLVDPVVDPLLEHVVRPSSADPPGAPVAHTSDSKRSALRVVAWLLAPAPLGAGGACADRVAATLAARCAPPPPNARASPRASPSATPPSPRPRRALDAVRSTRAHSRDRRRARRRAASGRRTHEGVPEPPTRLAVAAADCALAISARVAVAAAADAASSSNQPVGDGERSLGRRSRRSLAVVRAARSWWPPANRAPIVALDEIARRLDAMTFAAEMERGAAGFAAATIRPRRISEEEEEAEEEVPVPPTSPSMESRSLTLLDPSIPRTRRVAGVGSRARGKSGRR